MGNLKAKYGEIIQRCLVNDREPLIFCELRGCDEELMKSAFFLQYVVF